jgi:predicted unusual protein kinase regulating ubiquinone biosynthesis (AarF/ABC1/UbiB family)
MFSYLWLTFIRKFRGPAWYERALQELHIRNAERVKQAILELKGLFIKLGQLLSIMGNFLPAAFQKPLEALQDQIPARPLDEVRDRIFMEFGAYPETIFARFDEKPLAAASIGQAHRAQLHDGTEVVVKVQHLHIERIAAVDLEIIRRLTAMVSFFYHIRGMNYMYTQIKKMIEEELDFYREAANMQLIGKNLESEPGIVIPEVHTSCSTSRVMTTTWHSGVKISDLEQLDAWGLDRREIATCVLRVYSKMVFADGIYHADPHPGNILVKQDGTLVLLDFGAVAEISPALRSGIPMLIDAAIKKDTRAMIGSLKKMGFIAEGREAEKMAVKMIGAIQDFLENEVRFEGMNLTEIKVSPFNNSLTKLISDAGLKGLSGAVQVPKDYVLFNRMATLLLGLSSTLDPMLNPLDVIRPYARRFVFGEKESLFTFAGRVLKRGATNLIGLPEEINRVLTLIQRGELEFRSFDIRDSAKLVHSALRQIIFLILSLSTAAFGWLLRKEGDRELSGIVFGGAVFCLLCLLLEMRRGRRLEDSE